jgi:hypothetical protein
MKEHIVTSIGRIDAEFITNGRLTPIPPTNLQGQELQTEAQPTPQGPIDLVTSPTPLLPGDQGPTESPSPPTP